uniref:Uncharacterized protein n=1 Tax=Romanomermis culicivorax TaxID=13658 RepID=A0A915JFL8_ROMCU
MQSQEIGGGAYYMISRSLGPEFGGAIGILYYLANACAAGMYLAGGVELLLMYMAPNLPQFGDPKEYNEADMFNNFRVYGTVFVIIEFVICVIGMKLIQIVGPFSLGCVVLAIISVFAGGIAANSDYILPLFSLLSEDFYLRVCLVGERLLKPSTYMINGTAYCDKNQSHPIWSHFCAIYNETNVICDPYFLKHDVEYVPAIPGFSSGSLFSTAELELFPVLVQLSRNAWSNYMEHGETVPDLLGNPSMEVVQDMTTSFFVLLGILFPTFTDIICGANLSGDLKDPQTSLAVGVVAAQLSTSFVYLSFVLIYGGCVVGEVLRDKYGRSIGDSMIVAKLAWPHEWVLLVGCFTSTFGAALQCLYSAPKILHAIAKDDVLPFLSVFQKVTKRNREPVRALILTALLTEAVILIGGIDYIAPVCNCFFLMCYGAVNIVCGLQTLLKAPNWRPRFKIYHWSLSLLGALLCLFFMLGSNWYYSIMVILLTGAIYKYIEYKGLRTSNPFMFYFRAKKEWGDGIRGLALSTAQYSLLKAEENRMNAQNWRPQLLVLLKLEPGEENMNRKMLLFANQLKAGRGLTMAATLIEGNLTNHEDETKSQQVRDKLQEQMKEAKLKGFTEVVLVPDPAENICALIQCVGMGSLRPNTVIVGWPNNWKNRLQKRNSKYWDFLDTVHRVATNHMCLLVPKGLFMYPEPLDQLAGTIDVWWIIHDGGLMILLPFLLR